LASDDFNRANENPLTATNWSVPTAVGGEQVTGNLCAAANTSADTSARESCWKNETFGPDCYVQITVTTRPDNTRGVVLCLRGSNNNSKPTRTGYRMVWTRGGDCTIRTENGDNTETTIATAVAPTFNDGDIVRFSAVGSTITVTRNGTVTVVTVSNGTYTAAGYVGIGCSNNNGTNTCRLDNFSANSFASAVAATESDDWYWS
jgi:hypothetical protein